MMLGHFLPVKGPSMPVTSSSPESSREGPKLSIYFFFHFYGPSPRSIRQSLPRTALALNLRREWPQKLIFLLVALPFPEKEQTLPGTDSAPRLGKEGPHFSFKIKSFISSHISFKFHLSKLRSDICFKIIF